MNFEKETKLILECIKKGVFSQGEYVKEFEKQFSNYCNIKYASAIINGTAALHIALKALGIKEGDEVIVPSLTFIATANAVSYCGAKPIFVDCLKDTYCIDPKDIKNNITKKTKAIIPVHLYGNMCNMDIINDIAKKHNLFIIEDAAEALGAEFNKKNAGSFSDISCFSFYSNKVITTGEGGMCLTNNPELKEKIDILRAQGKKKNEELKDGFEYAQEHFKCELLGYNYRMTNLQAAIGIAQLSKLKMLLKKRREIANLYYEKLQDKDLVLPTEEIKTKHSYWMFPILVKDEKIKIKIMNDSRKLKLSINSFFYPCHKQPFYDKGETLKITENCWKKGIILPTDPQLGEEKINKIIELISENT